MAVADSCKVQPTKALDASDMKSALLVQVRKTKPEPRVCPVCSSVVGISSQSLAVHVKKAHAEQYADLADDL